MFITLEGPEGSGKTSQLPLLEQALLAAGYRVRTTREPGGTPIGDQIRKVLFDLGNKAMQPRTEILLFQSSRAQLVEEVIRPALAAGEVVLCDRYADSTMAYQGYGHQLELAPLAELVRFATGGLTPDLTLFLDIPPRDGLRRRDAGGNWNRLDDYQVEFHERVYAGYRELIAAEPRRWVVVDATRPPAEVTRDLAEIVLARVQSR
ncbi:MAG: dTMP kinase [Anaerolineales bacterium]|nr:dTMP kinase [Anaerolineales bacterium]MCW5838537.1 dTMP kinase [Anaerolineales bacterium]